MSPVQQAWTTYVGCQREPLESSKREAARIKDAVRQLHEQHYSLSSYEVQWQLLYCMLVLMVEPRRKAAIVAVRNASMYNVVHAKGKRGGNWERAFFGNDSTRASDEYAAWSQVAVLAANNVLRWAMDQWTVDNKRGGIKVSKVPLYRTGKMEADDKTMVAMLYDIGDRLTMDAVLPLFDEAMETWFDRPLKDHWFELEGLLVRLEGVEETDPAYQMTPNPIIGGMFSAAWPLHAPERAVRNMHVLDPNALVSPRAALGQLFLLGLLTEVEQLRAIAKLNELERDELLGVYETFTAHPEDVEVLGEERISAAPVTVVVDEVEEMLEQEQEEQPGTPLSTTTTAVAVLGSKRARETSDVVPVVFRISPEEKRQARTLDLDAIRSVAEEIARTPRAAPLPLVLDVPCLDAVGNVSVESTLRDYSTRYDERTTLEQVQKRLEHEAMARRQIHEVVDLTEGEELELDRVTSAMLGPVEEQLPAGIFTSTASTTEVSLEDVLVYVQRPTSGVQQRTMPALVRVITTIQQFLVSKGIDSRGEAVLELLDTMEDDPAQKMLYLELLGYLTEHEAKPSLLPELNRIASQLRAHAHGE